MKSTIKIEQFTYISEMQTSLKGKLYRSFEVKRNNDTYFFSESINTSELPFLYDLYFEYLKSFEMPGNFKFGNGDSGIEYELKDGIIYITHPYHSHLAGRPTDESDQINYYDFIRVITNFFYEYINHDYCYKNNLKWHGMDLSSHETFEYKPFKDS